MPPLETLGASAREAPSSCRLLSPACHGDPELFLGDAGRVLADDPALVDDEDTVRQRQDLLELERDEQDRPAFVTFFHESAVDELDRPHVKAAGRLCRHEDA